VLIEKLLQLRLNSGVLLAVPIPEAEAMEGKGNLYYHPTSFFIQESYVLH
jgi:hypothetical protein